MNQDVLIKSINNLSSQVAQLSVDKAILMAEVETLKEENEKLKQNMETKEA